MTREEQATAYCRREGHTRVLELNGRRPKLDICYMCHLAYGFTWEWVEVAYA